MGAGQWEWLHEMVDKSRRESLQITLSQVGSKQSGTRGPPSQTPGPQEVLAHQ